MAFGSIPASTQCTKPDASGSVTTSASSTVPDGTAPHETPGEIPPPPPTALQVNRVSITPPSAKGRIIERLGAVVDGGTVVVTIERVWFGFGGRYGRPSCEQAPSLEGNVSQAPVGVKPAI